MVSSEQFVDWLKKMEYPGPVPSDEGIQKLCRGAVGPIFQQIIDKVKPKSEIDNLRTSVLAYHIDNEEENVKTRDLHKQVELYRKKQQLEKELAEINDRNEVAEENLKYLNSKIRSKNARKRTLKHEIHDVKKDTIFFKAKSLELEKYLDNCKKLKKDSCDFEFPDKSAQKHIITENMNDSLKKITDTIEKLDLSSYAQENSFPRTSKNKSLFSINETNMSRVINTSVILSASKRPRSVHKNRASSSRRNIFESMNIFPSTRSRNHVDFTKHTSFLNESTLSSIANTSTYKTTIDNYTSDAIMALENACWNNEELQKSVKTQWLTSNKSQLWECLKETKSKDKMKLMNMVTENHSNVEETYENNSVEKLYACHIENEFTRMQAEHKQSELLKMFKDKCGDNVDNVVKLQAVEYGLKTSVTHLQNFIEHLKANTIDDTGLDAVLAETDVIRNNTNDLKKKVESHLCLLYDCNSWIEKCRRSAESVMSRSFPVIQEHILDSNSAGADFEKFKQIPFNYVTSQYMDSWQKTCEIGELQAIVKEPNLRFETIVSNIVNDKAWLATLTRLKTEVDDTCTQISNSSNPVLNVTCADKNKEHIMEKLEQSSYSCQQCVSQLNDITRMWKLRVEQPFDCLVSLKRNFNGKNFNQFVDEYNYYYVKLK